LGRCAGKSCLCNHTLIRQPVDCCQRNIVGVHSQLTMVSIQSGLSHVNLTWSIRRWHCCGLLYKTWICLVIQTSSAKRPFHCAVSDQVSGVIVSWQASWPTISDASIVLLAIFISVFDDRKNTC